MLPKKVKENRKKWHHIQKGTNFDVAQDVVGEVKLAFKSSI